MKREHVLVIGTVLVLFVAMGLAQDGKPVHWTVTGSTHLLGVDSGLGFEEGAMGICGGKGTFGDHTCNTKIQTGPITTTPPASNCVGELTMFTHVQRFPNGDLLYSRLPDGDPLGPNYVCSGGFKYWGTVTLEFVGGIGKFEGASGWVTWEFEGDVLEWDPAFGTVYSGSTNDVAGVLYLNGN